ncbi:Zinc finger protein-like 1 [Chytriomyces hyalinus]|nr:Zinc finger protein-like 1 [Chytriomyces hyalinus]
MGLCKCRNVTNLFCFEHRKNVCEKCIVTDHVKCVVKSYLQWLQDSDYDPSCQICKGSLDQGEPLRLACLDIFHVQCINNICDKLPETTAPAGYACPVCSAALIPPDNVSSQIAESVRSTFSNAKWAQNILPKKGAAPVVEPRIDTMVAKNAHNVSSPVLSPPLGSAKSDSVSIDTGILPSKKMSSKPSLGSVRDGDDDKYGKKNADRTSAGW